MSLDRIVSADDHMDLHTLPPTLFEERLPRAWRDRAPRVEDTDRGRFWMVDGKIITGEDDNTAGFFGETLARLLTASAP